MGGFGKFTQGFLTFISEAGAIVVPLAAFAILVVGVMLVYPSERTKSMAKDHIGSIILGIGIMLSAVQIATGLVALF